MTKKTPGGIAATPADLAVLDDPLPRPPKKWRNKYTYDHRWWWMCCDKCLVLHRGETHTTIAGCGVYPTAEMAEQAAQKSKNYVGIIYDGPIPCDENGSPL